MKECRVNSRAVIVHRISAKLPASYSPGSLPVEIPSDSSECEKGEKKCQWLAVLWWMDILGKAVFLSRDREKVRGCEHSFSIFCARRAVDTSLESSCKSRTWKIFYKFKLCNFYRS